jgi:hypothetical protein
VAQIRWALIVLDVLILALMDMGENIRDLELIILTVYFSECVRFVKSLKLPTLVLGGGGYTLRNVAR